MEDSVNETNALKIRVILVSIAMILKVLHSLDVVLVQRDIGEMVSIVYHLPVNKDHRHVSRYISLLDNAPNQVVGCIIQKRISNDL